MWVTQKESKEQNAALEAQIRGVRDDLYELRLAHERLMIHLGLQEKRIPQHTIIDSRQDNR